MRTSRSLQPPPSPHLGDEFRPSFSNLRTKTNSARSPPVASTDLKGKTVVVVGANTGLGFEAAKHFARMKAGRLILACRSQEKGEVAIQYLKEATGYSTAELWLVDLAVFASVMTFVDRALKHLERLDILVLNAAIAGLKQHTATTDGWEKTLQVNALSPSLLAILLLPRLLETAEQYKTTPRLVVVSSDFHYWTEIESGVLNSSNSFDVLGSKGYCTPQILKTRYQDTKLLNVFFVRALNNRLKNRQVIFNAVNPGFCYSELRRDMSDLVLQVFEKLLAWKTEEGSRQLVWAAVGMPGDGEGSLDKLQGAYINRASIKEPSDFVLGEEGKKREAKLWTDLVAVLGRVDARVNDVISQHLAPQA